MIPKQRRRKFKRKTEAKWTKRSANHVLQGWTYLNPYRIHSPTSQQPMLLIGNAVELYPIVLLSTTMYSFIINLRGEEAFNQCKTLSQEVWFGVTETRVASGNPTASTRHWWCSTRCWATVQQRASPRHHDNTLLGTQWWLLWFFSHLSCTHVWMSHSWVLGLLLVSKQWRNTSVNQNHPH